MSLALMPQSYHKMAEVNYVHIGVAKYEGNGLLLHLLGKKIITAPREGSDYTTVTF